MTLLSEKGIPTPVVHTRHARAVVEHGPGPGHRRAAKASPLWAKYGERTDAQSAREILAGRLAGPAPAPVPAGEPDLRAPMEHVPAPRAAPAPQGVQRGRRSATS